MSDPQPPDFSLLLASSVHDIKNSLGMLLASLDEVIEVDKAQQHHHNYRILRSEASRINNALIHLLGLYRLQNHQLSVNVEEIAVAEFLEEQVESQQLLFDVNRIHVNVHCDDNLRGFFDENLIAGVINNVLVNCAKYTQDQITLTAEQHQHYLHIRIADNGNGYPQDIIDSAGTPRHSMNFINGSTNLGLYFSQQIAALHQCQGRTGAISLSNPASGGGCFELQLP